ncbi:MAG: PIN domain-containing protein [Methanosarcinales archaeon]|uniref:PIN domain-containing protein n=1 Tax=Candidatus Ethanoperedens thermophilum TaxID=2766897 RepID=A0A848D5U2_9EURY|nr:PIN domain-containing protein [Candidatus Ethanoperedens thermophilum]
MNIYEIKYRIEQIRDEDTANDCITTIKTYTNVLNIDEEIALTGAQIRLKHKMGAVDSLILATAILHDLKVLTGDQHFDGMDEAVMI